MNIILASNSPRRKELLSHITNQFTVVVSNIEEKYNKKLLPHEIVLYLSQKKANEIYKNHKDSIIIGADTIVSIDNQILEKPIDNKDAFNMLRKLSGKTHQVITGVTIKTPKEMESFYSQTDVTFNDLSDDEINAYIATKEPFDKAGAYGIQGYASKFIKEIRGDYFTVVGLPVSLLYQNLKKLGYLS